MKIVLDANVALRWFLPEPHADRALLLREDARNGIHELLTTDFFPYEVANALTRAERRRAIPQGQAAVLLGDILMDCPSIHNVFHLLEDAVRVSSATRTSVYDMLYLQLAEEQDCLFVTADRGIVNAYANNPRIIDLATL